MSLMLHSPRLRIRPLTLDDADFIIDLLNEDGFIRYIADKGVRDRVGAENYLREGPLASYAAHGFGLWHVSLRESGEAMGMCGLLQRDYLPVPDLGYALLSRYSGQGYTQEAARAVLDYAQQELGLRCLQATTVPENAASIRVLEKLGFRFCGEFRVHGESDIVNLYQLKLR